MNSGIGTGNGLEVIGGWFYLAIKKRQGRLLKRKRKAVKEGMLIR
jgi:hypothetical protein